MIHAGEAAGAAGVLFGAQVRFTGRAEGDLRPAPPSSPDRLAAAAGRPVSWLHQVHGRRVLAVEAGAPVCGDEGDALVTAATGMALAVLTADCAPVALASPEGVVGAVHAGWAGLVEGVVEEAVRVMRRLGATTVEAVLGPCIHAECYEFGGAELERVTAALGPAVRGVTASGSPAVDLPAAVGAALSRAGATLVADVGVCTACAADDHFSHRARGERERQALLVWREA